MTRQIVRTECETCGKTPTGHRFDNDNPRHPWRSITVRYAPVAEIVTWLDGDEAERIRAEAIKEDVPPEDALADAIECKFGGRP